MRLSWASMRVVGLIWPLMALAQPVAPAEPLDGQPLLALPALDLNGLAATRERPLFSPSRRPRVAATPAVDEQEEIAPPPFDFILAGVASGPARSVAVFVEDGASVPIRAKAGDVVAGWTVARIGVNDVLLRNGTGEEQTLSIFKRVDALTMATDGSKLLRIGSDASVAEPAAVVAKPPADDTSEAASPVAEPPPEELPQDRPIRTQTPKPRRVY